MTSTGTVLDQIIAGVREDLEHRRRAVGEDTLRRLADQVDPARDAVGALRGDGRTMTLISEVKRSSPSKGSLAPIPDPAALARVYAQAGANAISVLTEQRRFGGSLADLDAVRVQVSVPVLRKDFVVDPYQVIEARAHGADLVLLMASALDDDALRRLYDLVGELGMTALVEVHDGPELERALRLEPQVIGVNARDLKTLQVDIERACDLLRQVPAGPVVHSVEDVSSYAQAGADAVLVGEALVTSGDPAGSVAAFRAVAREGRPNQHAPGI